LLLRRLGPPPPIALAVRLAVHLKVAIGKRHAAIAATEAADVVLDQGLILEVLTFNAPAAGATQTPVELMVV
jgi:hypothetical protein